VPGKHRDTLPPGVDLSTLAVEGIMSREIRSPQNDRVKEIARLLRDAGLRRETGLVVVEGAREVARAIENGWTPQEIYVDLERVGEDARALALGSEERGISVFRCSPPAFDKMSYRENPDGILAVGPSVGRTLGKLGLAENALLLVAERVEKPGNLGALLRTADGAGVDAVIVCDRGADLGNPNLVRASIGTLFYLPIAAAESSAAVAWLRDRGVRIVTTEPDADLAYTRADLTGPVAIVVGSEDEGLSDEWKRNADVRVRIPMRGKNDSLNVSVAAAVLLYEAVRQRADRPAAGEQASVHYAEAPRSRLPFARP
jgi:RNA methyltransferase, TrmH family